MDNVIKYQSLIKEAIQKHNSPSINNYDEFESQIILDDDRGHYLLLNVGWNEYERIFSCMLHIDLKDGKIWIRQDWTEGIVDYFLENDVPKTDIVLAFQAPYKRSLTGFAAA